METDIPMQLVNLFAFPVATLNNAPPLDVRLDDNDTVRSEANILQWMSYLPEDCIKVMIAMRWDVTT